MKRALPMPFEGSTSAPNDAFNGSGLGSIIAAIFARGVVVTRHTPQGSTQPFGQSTGTADDNAFVEPIDVASNLSASPGTAVDKN